MRRHDLKATRSGHTATSWHVVHAGKVGGTAGRMTVILFCLTT